MVRAPYLDTARQWSGDSERAVFAALGELTDNELTQHSALPAGCVRTSSRISSATPTP